MTTQSDKLNCQIRTDAVRAYHSGKLSLTEAIGYIALFMDTMEFHGKVVPGNPKKTAYHNNPVELFKRLCLSWHTHGRWSPSAPSIAIVKAL